MRPSRARYRPGVALLAAAAVAAMAPSPGGADSLLRLRAQQAALASRERGTVLDLYALDSRLESAHGLVASLDVRRRAVVREQADLRLRLRAARRTLSRATAALGAQLRALYEQMEPDTVGIVLGAATLPDAIDTIEDLRAASGATTSVIEEATAARARVARLARAVAARSRSLQTLELGARREEAALASAREARGAYLADLRRRDAEQASAIVALEARARLAAARARAAAARETVDASVTSFAARAPLAVAPLPPVRGRRTLVVVSTGYALPGTTATGLPVAHGVVAVDPSVIPLGTRLYVPGYGEAVAADTGPAITGVRVDLWFPTEKEALAWGWRTLTVTLEETPLH